MTAPQSSSPDIVEALRGLADTLMNGSGKTVEISYADIRHAADEIERLRASLQPATPTAGEAEEITNAEMDAIEEAAIAGNPLTGGDAVAGEAVAWIALSNDQDKVRIWWRDEERAKDWAKTHSAPVIPLYAHPRCVDAVLPLRSPDEAATATVPKGWKLVPERPTQRQMDAGLYQSSADSEWDDVYSIYADMIDVAPSVDERNEPVADPRPVVQPSWQPIETAPKDGTEIWLFGPAPEGPRITIGHWSQEEECRAVIGDCGGECRCPEYDYCEPSWMSADGGFSKEWPCTLWQPLPTPALPSTEGK
jgi:hypothetical protein